MAAGDFLRLSLRVQATFFRKFREALGYRRQFKGDSFELRAMQHYCGEIETSLNSAVRILENLHRGRR